MSNDDLHLHGIRCCCRRCSCGTYECYYGRVAAAGAAAGHGTAVSAAMAGAQLQALLWPRGSYESCYGLGRCCGRCAAAGAAMARGVPTRAATLGCCRGPWRCFKCYYGRGAPVGRGAAASAMPGCCFLRCCGRDCESGVPVSAATAWGAG